MTARRAIRAVAPFAGLALAASTAPVDAEVMASSDAGFAIRQERLVNAAPDAVWAALVQPARWWSPQHSWSGDAANFRLEPVPGGCFCEILPGGGVEHGRILFFDKPKLLRLSGALGPLQAEGLSGTLSIALTAQGKGTRLRFDYVVGGFARMPLAKIAPAVDGVMGEQIDRLARLFPS